MKLKNKIGAIVASMALALGGYMVLASTASATIPYSPTVNTICTAPSGSIGTYVCNGTSFNGTGRVTKYYHPGGYSVEIAGICHAPGSAYDGRIVFQSDGNLVEYGAHGVVDWASNTENYYQPVLALQSDGNIVIYGLDPNGNPDTVYWSLGSQYSSTRQYSFAEYFTTVVGTPPHGAGMFVLQTNGVWAQQKLTNATKCVA